MNIFEARDAIQDARNTLNAGDDVAATMAKLLCGRLRVARISGFTLAKLKHELRDFNMTTKLWKD